MFSYLHGHLSLCLLVPSKMTIQQIKEGSNNLVVSWNPPDPPSGIIINYTVQWREYNSQQYESAFTNELSYNIENLNVEHQYCVKVAAFTKVDRGEFSEEFCRNTSVGCKLPSVLCYIIFILKKTGANLK